MGLLASRYGVLAMAHVRGVEVASGLVVQKLVLAEFQSAASSQVPLQRSTTK